MEKKITALIAIVLTITLLGGCGAKETTNTSSIQDVSSIISEISSSPEHPYLTTEKKPYGIPEFTYGEASTYAQGDRYITVANGTKKENYNSYLKKLKNKGYKVYAENKIEDNCYTTLTNKKTVVTVYCVPRTGITRVIAEPKGDMYPREKDNNYTSKNIHCLLTGILGDKTYIDYGMGYVIRLSDGSFIIIDGGVGGENHVDSNNLLKILKDQSPKDAEKPVIAAWIFTHPHRDHVGTFCTFAADHNDKVVIEGFYYNFPNGQGGNGVDSAIEIYFSDVPTIRPHTGDKYYIKDAIIDVLFTYEDHLPRTIGRDEFAIGDANDASIMFKINLAGQTLLFTGDAMKNSLKNLLTSFDTSLKSDFIQLPHHGKTYSYDLNLKVNPTYALLAVSHKNYANFFAGGGGGHKGNMWLIDTPSVRQIIPLGNGTFTIPIPYNPTDAEIMDKVPTPETVYKDYSYLY